MAVPFSRTTRALRADDGRRSAAWLAAGVGLLAAWTVWLVGARVTLYEVSAGARVEAGRAVHPVDAAAGGRVVAAAGLRLDAPVRAGEVLVRLDASAERIELERERGRLASLVEQRAALGARLASEAGVLARARDALAAAGREGAARVREAEVAERLARTEAGRLAALHAGGAVSDAEMARGRAAADRAASAVEQARSSAALEEARARQEAAEGEARMDAIRGEAAALDAEAARLRASERRWALEMERKTVRAPVDGRLARVEPIRPGGMLAAGARVAEVVPDGRLRVVADLPVRATGRVRAGQAARLRLAGFEPTRYGTVAARVARVGTEPRAGRVRVECEVVGVPPAVPLQHGLAGTLEIAVGHATPAALLAGAADRALRGNPR
ncbi:MAG TPA: HlyD family efflux transporter periplasmic adaptor subunit [Longimicrobium sp.]|nr:HlyD family efflux transporter periplasmic adaptor subunit [Longimicrobium sp.]